MKIDITKFSGFSGFGTKPFGTGTQTGFGSGLGWGSSSGFGSNTFGQGTNILNDANVTCYEHNVNVIPMNSGFGQQTQQQQTAPLNPNEALLTSVYRCNIFGDERDQIIGNWNLLQAFWGTGKGILFEYSYMLVRTH